MDNLDKLSPEDKVLYGIECVARNTPMPENIKTFLQGEGLLEAILNPKEVSNVAASS